MADEKPPKELIRYYACNKHSSDALKNNYLWAADPLTFNDPFDCSIKRWNTESFTIDRLRLHIHGFDAKFIEIPERDKMISTLLGQNRYYMFNSSRRAI